MPLTWGRGKTVLVLAREQGKVSALAASLRSVGFKVVRHGSVEALAAALDEEPVAAVYLDCVLDAKGGRSSGIADAVKEARGRGVPLVAFAERGSATEVADVIRAGASDFIPAATPSAVLLERLHRVLHLDEAATRAAEGSNDRGSPGLVGTSAVMAKVFRTIERVARFRTSVLILGESGSGKELIARGLHSASARRTKPFVPVNCATLGRELLENELFGHEKGAFTGALARKQGLFELADGGTLFLDEIAEMDPSTQAKLLRVLERSEFRRVGGTTKVKIDVVVLAATNSDLAAALVEGRFREDLYYRLKVVTINVPPLRARREDIPALVETFIAGFNARREASSRSPIRGVAPNAMRRLTEHPWPGNVRELKNVIESASMLADADILDDAIVNEALGNGAEDEHDRRRPGRQSRGDRAQPVIMNELRLPLPATVADVERELIAMTLQTARSRREAASRLGIGLRTLYTKMHAYGLED